MSRPGYQRSASTNLTGATKVRSLEGKLAIVTGGSRGIGAAIARNLASKGASVALNYTSDSSTEITSSLASELQSEHSITALPIQADIGSPNGAAHLISTIKNHFSHPKTGKFQVDIIVNNAGVAANDLVQNVTPDAFHQMYAVNVLGPILLIKAAFPYLPTDRSGRIVNLSSVSSSLGFVGQSVYGGTKAALEAMTRTWSRELAERATVNAVNPGPVATDMYGSNSEEFQKSLKPWNQHSPLMAARKGIDEDKYVDAIEKAGGRPGYAHEIAGVVAMLCSEDSAWCTGSVICANGGMKMST
ncbi:hypothetical protein MMC12_001769 [Toensbergia leucococca]|nr:hypothetical protein [Toensbergia leucococca]